MSDNDEEWSDGEVLDEPAQNMLKQDIDFFNILVHICILLSEAWTSTVLCTAAFPKPLTVGKKTASTLAGFDNGTPHCQVTSTPYAIVIPSHYMTQLCQLLNIVDIVARADVPEQQTPGRFCPLLLARHQLPGRKLYDALLEMNIEHVRVVAIGGRFEREIFLRQIVEYAVQGVHCFDNSVNQESTVDTVPLVTVDEAHCDANHVAFHKLRLLDTHAGLVSMTVPKNRSGDSPEIWVEYVVCYPRIDHILRSNNLQVSVNFSMTNRQLITAVRKLSTVINQLLDVGYREHLRVHARSYRTEARIAVNGNKDHIAYAVANLNGTYQQLRRLTGVELQIHSVPIDEYVALLELTEQVATWPCYFALPGGVKITAQPLDVCRVFDMMTNIGRSPSYRYDTFVGRVATWDYNANDQQFNKNQRRLNHTAIVQSPWRSRANNTSFRQLTTKATERDGVLRIGDRNDPLRKKEAIDDILANCYFRKGSGDKMWAEKPRGGGNCVGAADINMCAQRVYDRFGEEWRLHVRVKTVRDDPPPSTVEQLNANGLPLADDRALRKLRADVVQRDRRIQQEFDELFGFENENNNSNNRNDNNVNENYRNENNMNEDDNNNNNNNNNNKNNNINNNNNNNDYEVERQPMAFEMSGFNTTWYDDAPTSAAPPPPVIIPPMSAPASPLLSTDRSTNRLRKHFEMSQQSEQADDLLRRLRMARRAQRNNVANVDDDNEHNEDNNSENNMNEPLRSQPLVKHSYQSAKDVVSVVPEGMHELIFQMQWENAQKERKREQELSKIKQWQDSQIVDIDGEFEAEPLLCNSDDQL